MTERDIFEEFKQYFEKTFVCTCKKIRIDTKCPKHEFSEFIDEYIDCNFR